MKTCTKCGETKALDEFHRDKRASDGLKAHCKACGCAYARNWNAANKDRKAEARRAWYEANRADVIAYQANYYAQNRDADIARRRRYAVAHLADEHMRKAAHRYRKRARSLGLAVTVEPFTHSDLIATYGDSCFYCETGAFEHLDHFIPVKLGGPHTLANVRPSCAACNLAKSDLDPDEWLSEQEALDDLTKDELDDLIDAEIERWTD